MCRDCQQQNGENTYSGIQKKLKDRTVSHKACDQPCLREHDIQDLHEKDINSRSFDDIGHNIFYIY